MSTMTHPVTRTATAAATRTAGRAAPRTTTRRPASRAGVRLTRRGRLVVFVLALLVVLAVGMFWAAGSVATDEAGTPEATEVVTVGSGETLWGIAAELAEDGDVREVMTRIERLNALDSSMLVAGQRLRVPVE